MGKSENYLFFGNYCSLWEYYQSCSNYDPGLTMTHFTPRSTLVTKAFVWEKVKIIFLKLLQPWVSKLLEAFG